MVSLWKLFLVFLKIGAFTIGGGYVMVPAIEAEIRKHGWIPEEELPDIVTLSQSAPGLLTANMAIFSGHRIRGLAGSIAATAGVLLAPILCILAIAMFLGNFRDLPLVKAMLQGIRPVAVAIIFVYTANLAKRNSRWWHWLITAITLFLVAFAKVSAIWILSAVIIVALACAMLNRRRRTE